ncbi:hypothetical protein GAIMETA21S03_27290 [Phocaeicola vulgatus]|nr:hypothetical protein GAIMETA21S03_27290 [Phocaeicola vulgatus]
MFICQSFIAATLLNVQLLGRYGRYGLAILSFTTKDVQLLGRYVHFAIRENLLLKNRAMQGIIEELKVLNFSGLSRNCLNNNNKQV